jgi:hypothetical protein
MGRSVLRRDRLAFLASPLLVLPIWNYSRHSEGVSGYVPTTGVVVDHVKVEPRMGFPRYGSVIEYSGREGKKLRIVDPVSRRPPETIGTSVKMLVEPTRRQSAVRGGLSGHWVGFFLTTKLLGLVIVRSKSMAFTSADLTRK